MYIFITYIFIIFVSHTPENYNNNITTDGRFCYNDATRREGTREQKKKKNLLDPRTGVKKFVTFTPK